VAVFKDHHAANLPRRLVHSPTPFGHFIYSGQTYLFCKLTSYSGNYSALHWHLGSLSPHCPSPYPPFHAWHVFFFASMQWCPYMAIWHLWLSLLRGSLYYIYRSAYLQQKKDDSVAYGYIFQFTGTISKLWELTIRLLI
jgi:hypothetical protein